MKRILSACLAIVLAAPVAAHEFWIEADPWQVQPGESVDVTLHNGQEFAGATLAYFSRRIARFDRLHDGAVTPVEGRDGDSPALSTDALEDGLHVLAYESTPARVTYDEFDAFMRFVDHKDLGAVRTRHANRGLPVSGFVESYTRFSKALIAVGDGEGTDAAMGLDHEFIALDNPYTDDVTGGMRVALERYGERRAEAQVELFARAPDGTVEITLLRTDGEGVVRLPVIAGHAYLVDAVVLFEPEGEIAASGAVWETDWAALTFAVP